VKFYSIGLCFLVCTGLAFQGWAQNPAFESKVRIGVLNLDGLTPDEEFIQKATGALVDAVKGLGFYEVHNQDAMEKAFVSIGKKFPRGCNDPRCVIGVGSAVQLDRMVYGTIDKTANGYGGYLTLVDVVSRQVIEKVNLQAGDGISLGDFFTALVGRLHGQSGDDGGVALNRYFGPEIHNEKQMLVSTAAWTGLGLAWGLINALSGDASTDVDFDDRLSGIPTRSSHIPMNARPAALAHAYTAASDDAYGILYNPAGLAWISGREAMVSYQYRFGMDNFAASHVNKGTREIGFGQALLVNSDREKLSSEIYFFTGGAYKFNKTPLSFLRPFSVGANVKVMSIRSDNESGSGEYQANDQSEQSFGIGFDFGLRAELSDQIVFGAVLKDLPSFVVVKNTASNWKYTEFNPVVLKMGGTFKVGYSTMLFAEGDIPLYKDQYWKMAGAIEQVLFRVVRLRFGAKKTIQEAEETPWLLTGGFGVDVNTERLWGKYLRIDGSYEFNQIGSFSNVLNFSFLFGF